MRQVKTRVCGAIGSSIGGGKGSGSGGGGCERDGGINDHESWGAKRAADAGGGIAFIEAGREIANFRFAILDFRFASCGGEVRGGMCVFVLELLSRLRSLPLVF